MLSWVNPGWLLTSDIFQGKTALRVWVEAIAQLIDWQWLPLELLSIAQTLNKFAPEVDYPFSPAVEDRKAVTVCTYQGQESISSGAGVQR
ncbi:hypothetical protein [Leptothermofonsia sp. ETS-13]|uniref:hypothetical protein n=1 Tax=Leptothermofonsia sp. ETS-13 TaxID=3035696 RepID=UPI003BA13155